MTTKAKQFNVPIGRIAGPLDLEWPSAEDLESDTLGGNRSDSEIEVARWDEVEGFVEEERLIIELLYTQDDVAAAHEEWLEGTYEDPLLYGFDLGTNALTAALSASRCIPLNG